MSPPRCGDGVGPDGADGEARDGATPPARSGTRFVERLVTPARGYGIGPSGPPREAVDATRSRRRAVRRDQGDAGPGCGTWKDRVADTG
ncbi:MAG TPA: hypothetical protein VI248_01690 [Kineosporiaceae bacterium]